MATRRATLADVARLAGLSPTSASMILNGRPNTRLSQEAHDRVIAAARELGYRPNVAARGLRTEKTLTIGFITDVVATTRFASGLIRGALQGAEEANHVMLVLETGGDPARETEAVAAVLDRQVDGIVFASMRAREFDVPEMPAGTGVVMLNATNPGHATCVLPDEYAGGRLAIDLLVRHGHRSIALLGQSEEIVRDPAASATVARRFAGIRDAMAEHGLTFAEEVPIDLYRWEPDEGFAATAALLARRRDIGALLCMNDRLAFGAYQALAEAGLAIPRDVSVISFDNDELAAYLRPGLTTIALPHEAMGRRAVELLLSDPARGETLIEMPAVLRESIASV